MDRTKSALRSLRRVPTVISEMVGKENPLQWFSLFSSGRSSLWRRNQQTTIDYARNDYDLFKSIYYASIVNGKGKEYQLAAALGRPVINITTGFVVGKGFQIELDNPQGLETILEAEAALNEYVKANQGSLYDLVKFGYRDGDSYLYIDELGSMTLLDPQSVDVILDEVTGRIVGYDVTEHVKLRDPGSSTDVPWTYLKQYRTDSVRYSRFRDNQPESKIVMYERVYTTDGVVEPDSAEDAIRVYGNLIDRRLSVIPLHNEPEPKAVYGNSELQNLLVLFKNYTSILMQGTKGNIYNSTPLPVLKGVTNPKKLQQSTQAPGQTGPDQAKLDWDQDSIIYLTGEKSDAKFLQANEIMGDVGKLLEIYFFLIVQGSETPEFAFGTAIASSKASTETQMPVFVGKVERKRTQLTELIENLILTYIEHRQYLSDVRFINLPPEITVRVNFPSIIDEDRQLTLDTVQWAVENNLMTGKTALELVAGDKVKDIDEEIKAAAAEAAEKAEAAGPVQASRLFDELANKAKANQTTTPPADDDEDEDE